MSRLTSPIFHSFPILVGYTQAKAVRIMVEDHLLVRTLPKEHDRTDFLGSGHRAKNYSKKLIYHIEYDKSLFPIGDRCFLESMLNFSW